MDIGAQFFTLRNPRFRALIDRWAGRESYTEWPGRLRYQLARGDWEDFHQATRYVGVPRMTAISRGLSVHLTVHSRVRVGRLVRSEPGWRVMDAAGGEHGVFDAVVLAMPPAQSRELLVASGCTELAGMLAADVAAMDPCWALAVYFQRPLGLACDGFQSRLAALQWAGNDTSKPGREGPGEWWVLHGHPGWSRSHSDDTEDTVAEALLADFRTMSGVDRVPDRMFAHRWLYARSSVRDGPGHYWSADDRLAVIGDWLTGGRVEGAFNSAASLFDQWVADSVIVSGPGL